MEGWLQSCPVVCWLWRTDEEPECPIHCVTTLQDLNWTLVGLLSWGSVWPLVSWLILLVWRPPSPSWTLAVFGQSICPIIHMWKKIKSEWLSRIIWLDFGIANRIGNKMLWSGKWTLNEHLKVKTSETVFPLWKRLKKSRVSFKIKRTEKNIWQTYRATISGQKAIVQAM